MFSYKAIKTITSITDKKENKSVPITLVRADEFENWKSGQSPTDQTWVESNNFKALKGSTLIFSSDSGNRKSVIASAGDGNMTPWDFAKIASSLPDGHYHFETKMKRETANTAAFGWAMAHYNFDYYLKDKKNKNAVLFVADECDFSLVMTIIKGTFLTRDLVNTPTCDMGPSELATVCEEIAKTHKAHIQIKVGEQLLEAGYRTIHAVGRAAEKAPRLIDMTWGNESAPKVTLVGKGVCFDTGGLDIKSADSMLIMKKDMGGAAHVLGLGLMIMELGLDVRLRILIPAVENNISGNAFRPGDIIKSYQGTTIEIGNTDAEGRLVLCDALALACEEKPDIILDFATLTGAARVAMGPDLPPFFTNDDNFADDIMNHSGATIDPLWQLPLYPPYKKLLASNVADINNVTTTSYGGAITAALFLKHFISDGISWVHFDVYAWNSSSSPGRPKGGEAMGLRAVFSYLIEKFGS